MNGYPAEMQESLRRVEASRMRRLDETYPRMSMEESERVLDEFHPDYIGERMRAIRVGVTKGQRMPLELADIVEGRPHISPRFDLSK
ncbi:MAG: succinate dehydrogenase/fumarate reductase flavoprotein subunit, partial [Anaerolineae bacterium]